MLKNLQTLIGTNINDLSKVLESYASYDFTKQLDSTTCGKIGNEIMELNAMITKMLNQNNNDGIILENSSEELSKMLELLVEMLQVKQQVWKKQLQVLKITSNIQHTNDKAQRDVKNFI